MELVVLGGGTAGWMTALLTKVKYPNANITVVESDEIGILGAGEGTTTQFIDMLDSIGVGVGDIIRHCRGTLKLGINFVNWNNDGNSYFHSFNAEPGLTEFFGDNIIPLNHLHNDRHLSELSFSAKLSYENKVCLSFKNNINTYINNDGMMFDRHGSYGLHFDATLLAKHLRAVSESRGIYRVEGKVNKFHNDDSGNITTLSLENGKEVPCDFIFDCSGFARLIVGKHFSTPWVSYNESLPMDTALPFFIEHDNNVSPVTESIAMKYGWVWKIPVQGRYGCGYVFDSSYITKEDALKEVEEYFGCSLNSPRTFKFEAGSFKSTLVKNCMAVGLSQSFVEPLEATSIWVSYTNLNEFLNSNGVNNYGNSTFASKFNKYCETKNEEVVNFLYLHYLTNRNDSDFWKEFRVKNKMRDSVRETLELLNVNPNSTISFSEILFPPKSWIQVASGLKLLNSNEFIHNIEQYSSDEIDRVTYALLINQKHVSTTCMSHKDFLNFCTQ